MTTAPVIPSTIPQRFEEAVPLEDLVPHPMNPNHGDAGLVGELIDANGFAVPVLAQASTGLVIDGEHRIIAARQHGMTTIPVVYLDVDDKTRDRLLASINHSTRQGRDDEAALVALLQGIATAQGTLTGTGRTGEDLDDLIRFLEAPPLDDLDGNHNPSDAWPSVSIRAPHHLVAAWNEHAKAYGGDDAAAFAQLLGLEVEP